jgi:hypothetical protein
MFKWDASAIWERNIKRTEDWKNEIIFNVIFKGHALVVVKQKTIISGSMVTRAPTICAGLL